MSPVVDFFELFQLPRQFDIDISELVARYRAVQAQVHPDKHAAGSDQERLKSMQYSTRANDAYQCLKSPLRRACHLLELADVVSDFGNQTIADADFLMLQMGLREDLEEVCEQAQLDTLQRRVKELLDDELVGFVQAYEAENFSLAKSSVSKLHFLYKLRDQSNAVQDKLDDI